MSDLPNTVEDWRRDASAYNVGINSSIHRSVPRYKSASDMPIAQFFLLRVLYIQHGRQELKPKLESLLGKAIVTSAETRVGRAAAWQDYIRVLPDKLETRGPQCIDAGKFTGVRWSQLLLNNDIKPGMADKNLALWDMTPSRRRLRSRARRPDLSHPNFPATPATPLRGYDHEEPSAFGGDDHNDEDWTLHAKIASDEQLVTSFRKELIDMIHLTMFEQVIINHSIKRTTFRLGDLFTAAVDGTDAFTVAPYSVKAIYEDKRYMRGKDRAVRMQEAGEMACWIYGDSDLRPLGITCVQVKEGRRIYRRVLISLDCNEFYVTLAEYDDRYIAYIRHETALEELGNLDGVFMEMHEYGPYSIFDKAAMTYFVECYVTLNLQWRTGYGWAPPNEGSAAGTGQGAPPGGGNDRGRDTRNKTGGVIRPGATLLPSSENRGGRVLDLGNGGSQVVPRTKGERLVLLNTDRSRSKSRSRSPTPPIAPTQPVADDELAIGVAGVRLDDANPLDTPTRSRPRQQPRQLRSRAPANQGPTRRDNKDRNDQDEKKGPMSPGAKLKSLFSRRK